MKTLKVLFFAILLCSLSDIAIAQTKLFRFESAINDWVLTYDAASNRLRAIKKSTANDKVDINQLFIMKEHNGSAFIAPAANNERFLNHGFNFVNVAGSSGVSNYYIWRLDYAGENFGALVAADNPMNCLSIATDGSMSMRTYTFGQMTDTERAHIRLKVVQVPNAF